MNRVNRMTTCPTICLRVEYLRRYGHSLALPLLRLLPHELLHLLHLGSGDVHQDKLYLEAPEYGEDPVLVLLYLHVAIATTDEYSHSHFDRRKI